MVNENAETQSPRSRASTQECAQIAESIRDLEVAALEEVAGGSGFQNLIS